MKHRDHLQYLQQYSSEHTVKGYKSTLRQFFNVIYGRSDNLSALATIYFRESRDHAADVQQFFVASKDKAPKSIQYCLSVVKTFLLENGVELRQLFWRRLRRRIKGSRALIRDRVPTNAELRQIMMHLPLSGKTRAR
jgi:hypothetical protein